jgi:hypothetical protein
MRMSMWKLQGRSERGSTFGERRRQHLHVPATPGCFPTRPGTVPQQGKRNRVGVASVYVTVTVACGRPWSHASLEWPTESITQSQGPSWPPSRTASARSSLEGANEYSVLQTSHVCQEGKHQIRAVPTGNWTYEHSCTRSSLYRPGTRSAAKCIPFECSIHMVEC